MLGAGFKWCIRAGLQIHLAELFEDEFGGLERAGLRVDIPMHNDSDHKGDGVGALSACRPWNALPTTVLQRSQPSTEERDRMATAPSQPTSR